MSGTPMVGVTTAVVAANVAHIANAIKASGSVVKVEPDEFRKILDKIDSPLVVESVGGFFSVSYKYLTSYKGLAFYCKSPVQVEFDKNVEIITAKKIVFPDL